MKTSNDMFCTITHMLDCWISNCSYLKLYDSIKSLNNQLSCLKTVKSLSFKQLPIYFTCQMILSATKHFCIYINLAQTEVILYIFRPWKNILITRVLVSLLFSNRRLTRNLWIYIDYCNYFSGSKLRWNSFF